MRLQFLFLGIKRNDSSNLGQPKMEYDSSNLDRGSFTNKL